MGSPTRLDQLCQAVRERRVVYLAYSGDEPGDPRVCYPHVVFTSTSGKICADVYQVGGYTSSGRLPTWRAFEIGEIANVELSEERFEVIADYNPANRARYVRIFCNV